MPKYRHFTAHLRPLSGKLSPDHVAGAQGRHQLGFNMKVEHLAIHRSIDHPRGIEAVMAQGTDEGLGAPMAERRVIDQALPARGPASVLGHVGLEHSPLSLHQWRDMAHSRQ